MAQHRSRSPHGVSQNARHSRSTPEFAETAAETTDIIPFNEFGDLEEVGFHDSIAFDRESEVIAAPELDDLNDTDEQTPLRLAVPTEFRPTAREERPSAYAYRDSHTDVSDGAAATDVIRMAERRGLHRKAEATGATKGRLMIAAMAAGATAAGAHSVVNDAPEADPAENATLAASNTALDGAPASSSVDGMQVVSVQQAASTNSHSEEHIKAAAFAQERAEREARLQRPQFVMPTSGVWTSGFGYRWGVLHGGIDIANSVGTPILAAADGVVVDVGPTAGYGAWVKLRHSDGTVTLYGHLNSWSVSMGQQVMAGDEIATMGSRGNSTGPHLHFEVLLNGSDRVDPTGWLSSHGLGSGSSYMR